MSSPTTNLDKARRLYGDCVTEHHIELGSGVEAVLATLRKAGNPLIVGGCVRDSFIGRENKDIDIEVHGGATMDGLIRALRTDGFRVDEVGKLFGVLKVSKKNVVHDIDVSVPRRESKIGAGHRGFEVTLDNQMTIEEACARRDFTFNAIMYDPTHGVLVDPFNGREDLANNVLRHVSEAFMEDPLRVLRGFQFAGRFNMIADAETIEVCRSLRPTFKELTQEGVIAEWDKFYSKSVTPSAGIRVLQDFGWDDIYAGLSEALHDHEVIRALDELPNLDPRHFDKTALGSAIIARHMPAEDAELFIRKTVLTNKRQILVRELVKFDSRTVKTSYDAKVVARELFGKGFTFEQFEKFSEMRSDEEGLESCAIARSAGVFTKPEEPFVQGRDLLAVTGAKPGKWMGKVLSKTEDQQYRGVFGDKESALSYALSMVPTGF